MKHGVDVQEAALRTGARPDHADWGEEPPELSGVLGAGENAEVVPTRRGAYPEFYRRVVLAMQGSGPAPVDPLEAAAVIMVIEAARMSAHAGQVVSLERGTDRSLT